MPMRAQLVRTVLPIVLLGALLAAQSQLAALLEPRLTRSEWTAALFLVATGLGIAAVRQGRGLLFRSLDSQAAVLWRNLVSWTLYLLLALLVASGVGFNLSNLLVGGATLGVVVAAAAQAPLGNFFAGLVLMVARPYRIGTTLRLRSSAVGAAEYEGTVIDSGALYTTLRTATGEVLRLPNSAVVSSAMVIGRPPLQARMDLEVPPGTPLAHIRQSLQRQLGVRTGAVTITPNRLQAGKPGTLVCAVEVRSVETVESGALAEALHQALESVRPVLVSAD